MNPDLFLTGLPTSPFSLGVSNIQSRSVLLQFIQGSDGNSPITHWIVEALKGDHATDYKEIYNVSKMVLQNISFFHEIFIFYIVTECFLLCEFYTKVKTQKCSNVCNSIFGNQLIFTCKI